VCAYNEARNIGKLLSKLVKEPLLNGVFVVASGCTDNTIEVAKQYSDVKVLVQESRKGKASAVNLFLKSTKSDIVILESGDTIPGYNCIKTILRHFEDPNTGMVGAHSIPVNNKTTVMGKIAHFLWECHHQLALKHPKMGELIAFRHIEGIDPKSAVDEASIEQEIVRLGLRIIYEPDAIVFNKGPETFRDFIRQRKRIYKGHLELKKQGYEVTSMSTLNTIGASIKSVDWRPKGVLAASFATLMELYSRFTAPRLTNQTVWEISESTKELL